MENIIESILHEYPYPIAKCYEKVLGAKDMLDRWNKVRYLFEAALKYCSCISIAQYLQTAHDDQNINFALNIIWGIVKALAKTFKPKKIITIQLNKSGRFLKVTCKT